MPVGENAISLTATDPSGRPVVSVASFALRPIAPGSLTGPATGQDCLYHLDWAASALPPAPEVPPDCAVVGADDLRLLAGSGIPMRWYPDLSALAKAVKAGEGTPQFVLVPHFAPAGSSEVDIAASARVVAHQALVLARSWLSDENLASSRLIFLTRGAIATRRQDRITDLAAAPVWGLIRTADLEYPRRFALLDIDGPNFPLARALAAVTAGEPALAVRDGRIHVPRLATVPIPHNTPAPPWPDDGTILITGGTGALGAHLARHLATRHGVRHLLLTSRRGEAAPGAADLHAELTALSAAVTIVACDVTDRDTLRQVLDGIPIETPLRAVVHIAGVLDDGVLTALTPDRMDTVLRPKVDAAWHLHELTEHHDLAAFVLFSSGAGTFGAPGQANHAAANVFLDALAHYRVNRCLPAHSLAWGMWSDGGMAADLAATDRIRMARSGVLGMSAQEGLALLDHTLTMNHPTVVPMRMDTSAIRPGPDGIPAILRGLVRAPVRKRADTIENQQSRLNRLTGKDLDTALVDLIRTTAAYILGHEAADNIDPDTDFLALGFDSLTAIEFRNRLTTIIGTRLEATLIFDHPSVTAVAARLRTEVTS